MAARGRKKEGGSNRATGASLTTRTRNKTSKVKEGVLPRMRVPSGAVQAYSIKGMAIVHSNAQAW